MHNACCKTALLVGLRANLHLLFFPFVASALSSLRRELFIPLVWVHEHFELSDDMAQDVVDNVLEPIETSITAISAFAIFGLIFLAVSLICIAVRMLITLWPKKSELQVHFSRHVMAQEINLLISDLDKFNDSVNNTFVSTNLDGDGFSFDSTKFTKPKTP